MSHAASEAQLPGQLPEPPLQTYAPQSGAPVYPAGRSAHVPTAPARLHASQPPAHAVLQHTPSTQEPEAHSALEEQTAPFDFGNTHAPPRQLAPAAHWEEAPQLLGHVVKPPLHR